MHHYSDGTAISKASRSKKDAAIEAAMFLLCQYAILFCFGRGSALLGRLGFTMELARLGINGRITAHKTASLYESRRMALWAESLLECRIAVESD